MFGNLFKKADYKQLIADGAVPGSENIPLPTLSLKMKQIKSLQVPIICVCASGMRSGTAKVQLKAAGVEAYNGGPWTKMLTYVE